MTRDKEQNQKRMEKYRAAQKEKERENERNAIADAVVAKLAEKERNAIADAIKQGARDHELFEAAWMEHRDELTVGVPECVAKVTFQHGWVAGVSSRKRPRIK